MIDLEQYRLIVENSPNMIWKANLTTECDYFNKRWMDFTGRTMEQERGFGWAEGVHPDDLDRCVKIYLESFKNREPFEMDYRLKRHDGQYRWINDQGVPFNGRDGVFAGYIGSCIDITEKVQGQMLIRFAQNDVLCNTYNRQYAYVLLNEIFDAAIAGHKMLSILMMDIDDFKNINDKYGHSAGDSVLTHVAAAVKKEIRSIDILGRYGGDEFVIGLVETGLEGAMAVARRIGISISESVVRNPDPIKVTVSVGVQCLKDEKTLDELVHNADRKLYEAKKEGKNRISG